ncbi:MAG TPA: helix-turn-helix domain-containing protein [Polyangia bacterium]|nr:helix-turn-helix domain-containing protein [Polyangia bacterium]
MEQSKKDCILHAATRAFARFGFKKASVEEIAKSAGVAKGTVYLAAETKEDLFYQSVHREVRAWTAELAKLVDPRVPADQLLASCAQAGLAYLNQKPLVRELLFGSYHLMLPEWTERLDQLRELGRANLLEILRLGVRQQVFREDLDLEEVAKIIQDVMIATYLFYNRGVDREQKVARRMATAFEMLMGGLRSRKKTHAEHAA